MNRLFENLPGAYKDVSGSHHLNVAVAVVDRIPAPSTRGRNTPPLTDHGSEGLSYVVSAISELCVTSDSPPITKPKLDEIKTLSLLIGDAFQHEAVGTLESEDPTLSVKPSNAGIVTRQNIDVQVSLASTVFQAGQPSILSLSSWAWRKAEGRCTLEQKITSSPSHVSFKYPFVHTPKMKMPLVPMTPPRKIVAGMGNVIRQIERDTEHMTASQELEPAVSSYFIAKDLPPSAVNVWALIIPAHMYLEMESDIHAQEHFAWLRMGANSLSAQDLHQLWQRQLAFAPHNWSNLVHRGARLHRVLSGGGGWGKKAGLISLDPDSDFKGPPASESGAMFANSDLFETQEGMLGNAAKVGDLVQFYICPPNTTAHAPPSVNHGMRLEIGTIPSTIDAMPLAEVLEEEDRALRPGSLHYHHFGFLSEKGVSITTLKLGSDMSWTPSSRTKISVPFSRLIFGRTTTNDLLFTSSQGKITPIQNEPLPSDSNKISPLDSRQSGTPAQEKRRLRYMNFIERRKERPSQDQAADSVIAKMRNLIRAMRKIQKNKSEGWENTFRRVHAQLGFLREKNKASWNDVTEVLRMEENRKQAEARNGAEALKQVEQQAKKSLLKLRAERVVELRRKSALTDDYDYGGLVAGGPVISKHAVKTTPSSVSQRNHIRKMTSYLFGSRNVPAEMKEKWVQELRPKFPSLNLRNIRRAVDLHLRWARLNSSTAPQYVPIRKMRTTPPPKIRKHLSVPLSLKTRISARRKGALRAKRAMLVDMRKLSQVQGHHHPKWVGQISRRSRQSRARKTPHWVEWKLRKFDSNATYPIPGRVVSETSRASWTSLQRRRARGSMGVKMRSRYEEGLETALIREHLRWDEPEEEEVSSWDRMWLGKGRARVRVEMTAELKAEKKALEEKENEELLSKIKDLLKGF